MLSDTGSSDAARIVLCLAFIMAVAHPLRADEAGESLFLNYCAECHGADAKGLPPEDSKSKIATPDLTRLTVKFGGVFPRKLVESIVDGRNWARAHASDMPTWGTELAERAESERHDAEEREAVARAIISQLVDYLESVQTFDPK
jgi:mono/diheme cytochrome c family protein